MPKVFGRSSFVLLQMDPQKFLKTMKPLFCLKNIGHLWDGIILAKEHIRGIGRAQK